MTGFDFSSMLGSTLLNAEGKQVPTSDVTKGNVFLYFSAHWCPPCRGFTPKLADFYKANAGKKNFEVVFLSSDRDVGQFEEYRKEMPWYSVPFEERQVKEALSRKFKVRGIPSLVLLDNDGKTISENARGKVMEDPAAEEFPWRPQPVQEILQEVTFVTQESQEKTYDQALGGKDYIGLYFSASWCGPCRSFTPSLISTYQALQKAGKSFEIVFVSSDRDEASFNEYRSKMPWVSSKFGTSAKRKLSDAFQVEGIPTFVLIDAQGKVINADARGAVGGDPSGANFPWLPPLVKDVNRDDVGEQLNGDSVVVVLAENADDSTQDDIKTVLEPFAQKKLDTYQGPYFFVATADGHISKQIRRLLKLKQSSDYVIMLELGEEQYYVGPEDSDVSSEELERFVKGCADGSIAATKLS